MADYHGQSDQLMTSLTLALPPVAIAFCESAPDNVPSFDGFVAAGCAFWEEAATRTFATSAIDHALCSIGIHTHNLSDAPASQPAELQAALQAMIGLDYVNEEEVSALPIIQREVKCVVYGPLADFPMDAEVILVFANAQQGLILSEATARVDGSVPPAMGRPACAVVPHVLNSGNAALSLGCCGAWAYLDALSDGVALWALPASKLEGYCAEVEVLAWANKTLSAFHERRRKDVQLGRRPTVSESLQRRSDE